LSKFLPALVLRTEKSNLESILECEPGDLEKPVFVLGNFLRLIALGFLYDLSWMNNYFLGEFFLKLS